MENTVRSGWMSSRIMKGGWVPGLSYRRAKVSLGAPGPRTSRNRQTWITFRGMSDCFCSISESRGDAIAGEANNTYQKSSLPQGRGPISSTLPLVNPKTCANKTTATPPRQATSSTYRCTHAGARRIPWWKPAKSCIRGRVRSMTED